MYIAGKLHLMDSTIKTIYEQLEKLENTLLEAENNYDQEIKKLHTEQQDNARNFIHYLKFRSMDVRNLQVELHNLGLSSLTSSESHIMCQIQSVLERLGKVYKSTHCNKNVLENFSLKQKSEKLFGEKAADMPYLMVTFDKNFSYDLEYIQQLLDAGMNVARINCAHDDEMVWAGMIRNIRKAQEKTGKDCKIYMDLAGPKVRTEILGKGKKKSFIKIEEKTEFLLAEKTAEFNPKDIVIGCGLDGIVPQLKPNEHILFDDGALEARVLKVEGNTATLELLRNSKSNMKLKAEKGINFPDSDLNVKALTDFDRECLPFICANADIVGYSFIKCTTDFGMLRSLIAQETKHPKIILKIETPDAVKNLPQLLLHGMKDDVFGVMIARGDLAVEVGFERLSEIQDEILWFCEAAHVPVVWATQVLETLHKTGMATRSEVTDAAHATMAECVMINKGNYTLEVIHALKDILSRNMGHHNKKTYNMRPLKIAKQFFEK